MSEKNLRKEEKVSKLEKREEKWNSREFGKYFIEPELQEDTETEQPGSYIRRSIRITKEVQSARLAMTALGVYEGSVNGTRLGIQMLTPGYTNYHYRVQYQTYDVKELLCHGENVIAAVIGDGWYRGCIDIGSKRNCYGTKTKWMFCLAITYEDGTEELVWSDEKCRATQAGPLRENNLKTLERYDARKELPGWNMPETDPEQGWHGVRKSYYDGLVVPQEGEQVLEHEHFQPKVLYTPDGNTVLDMGQNFAGYVSFRVTGKTGHCISLTMGEVLDEHGNFTMKNLAAEGASAISGEVGQRLEYILKEGTQEFHPLFLYCGFRYVLVENWPEEVREENFAGIAVYSDIPQAGEFTCSNEQINQLVRNVRWSQKSNFVDIPGDCPTRERSGWTADISVFCETACYLSNPRKFLKKWLEDYKSEQSEDGNLPFVVPGAGKPSRQRGCMGWSNAICNISMTLYQFYGEKADLEAVYDCVKRFVDFNVERAKKKNPFFCYKTGAHRKYIIETGFHYGEWLEPGTVMYKDYIRDLFYPDTEVTTAWFFQTTMQLAKMAQILKYTEDMEYYRNLAKKIYQAYQTEFLKDGKVHSKRQCRYVRPLSMGLIPGDKRAAAAEELNRMCQENAYKIGTGFLTTWKLLSVLTDAGYADNAYRILENTEKPGWLYAVTKGATTTWENWYGLTDEGVPVDSHNHFAPGAVVAWLFSTCAGIRPGKPGFEKIWIKPVPGGTLKFARAEYQSCKGKIVSDWKIGDDFQLHVEIPEGAEALIELPDGTQKEVTGGCYDFSCRLKMCGNKNGISESSCIADYSASAAGCGAFAADYRTSAVDRGACTSDEAAGTEFTLIAKDGLELSCARFDAENPKAVVQMIHGAKEHKERYYDFIRFLNRHGYAVVISDNRGHGKSLNARFPLGHMEGVAAMLDDQYRITKYIKEQYPGKAICLFGHSFGSCLARNYLQKHDDEIEKLILSGTANYIPASGFGQKLGKAIMLLHGKKGHHKTLMKMGDGEDDSWVVKNPEVKAEYRRDPLCTGYQYTNSAVVTVWESDNELKKYAHFACRNPELKILSVTGEEDPIPGGAEGLADTVNTLHRIGYRNVTSIVYPGMKHEVLNEEGRQQVYEDILAFLSAP